MDSSHLVITWVDECFFPIRRDLSTFHCSVTSLDCLITHPRHTNLMVERLPVHNDFLNLSRSVANDTTTGGPPVRRQAERLPFGIAISRTLLHYWCRRMTHSSTSTAPLGTRERMAPELNALSRGVAPPDSAVEYLLIYLQAMPWACHNFRTRSSLSESSTAVISLNRRYLSTERSESSVSISYVWW